MKIRILIIEDEIIIGRYIQQLLAVQFNFQTRLAITIDEAKAEAAAFLPQLVLSDINLNETNDGIELVEDLQKKYHFETIFITSYRTKAMIERASSTMPTHYIVKPIDEKQLIATLELVRIRLAANTLAGTTRLNIRELLTKTEYDVLKLISHQKTTKQIGERLFISPMTVKNHRHHISRKLQLPSDNNALMKWVLAHREEVNF